MKNTIKIALKSVLLTTLTFQFSLSKADGLLTLTTGVDYSSGKYGQSQSTEMTYVPFIAKYDLDNSSYKLTFPWLQIKGPGDVVGGNSPIVLGKSNRPITTQSGLGDIVFSASHTIVRTEEKNPLTLDLTGKIKFATASSTKYLGTGRNDYTLMMEAYKNVSHSVTLFGDGGYKVLGDPNGIILNDVWFATGGLSYKLTPNASTGLMVDTRQATTNTSAPVRELTIFLTQKFNSDYKLQGYLSHGYSNATADWGGGLMLGLLF